MNDSATPNVLYILADDLGWGDVGWHGSAIRTPTLDRLASEGLELTQHYVCPMCTPTRAALMTGRHPGRFGGHATTPSNPPVLPDGYRTMATLFREAGYETGLFGKWHLGSAPRFNPLGYGFDTAYGSLAGGVDPYNHRYKRGEFERTWHRDGELFDEVGHVTDLITDAAVEWIESRQGPWFCYVPYTAVHIPIKPRQDWLDRYQGERFDPDLLRDRSFKRYAAYTSHMDHCVGRLLESLERLCQRENTIVVFSSDNGAITSTERGSDLYPGFQEANPRLGDNGPWRGHKSTLYEGGIRTPTVVSWRSQLRTGTCDATMDVSDWMPTFAGLLGAAEGDAAWDGRDAWPLLTGERAALDDRGIYWNFKAGAKLAYRRDEWKLIVHADEDRRELYDLEADPRERHDRADDRPEVVAALGREIEAHRKLDDTSKRPDVA